MNRGEFRKYLLCIFVGFRIFLSPALAAVISEVYTPVIEGDWWQVAGNPDLGKYTDPNQQPVDFAVWQAEDGSWQLWSCIRNTKAGGHTRLFYRWEGKTLTDTNWTPMGIAMMSDKKFGEPQNGLQAPHVVKWKDEYWMAYGDWDHICLAKSKNGKDFERVTDSRWSFSDFHRGFRKQSARRDAAFHKGQMALLLYCVSGKAWLRFLPYFG